MSSSSNVKEAVAADVSSLRQRTIRGCIDLYTHRFIRARCWRASLSLLVALHPGSPVHAQTGAGFDLEVRPAVTSIASLPDFSYSGRGSAAQEPPAVTRQTHQYFDVTEFGATPDDGLSDRAAVDLAIAAAEAHSGPSVVWFPAGRFVLRGPDDVGAGSIRIRRSEVVLKGAGMYSGGTELFLASESAGEPAFLFWPVLDSSVGRHGARTLTILAAVPRRGQREVTVVDLAEVSVGDIVRLHGVLPDTFPEFRRFFEPLGDDALIQRFFVDSSGTNRDWRSDFLSVLEVEAVEGNVLRFKEPLHADYEFVSTTYRGGPKLVQIFADGDDFLRDVGVEDLAFVSNYRDTYSHFFNRASDGYNFLGLDDVRESWVRRVRMRAGTRGITFGRNGKNNVVYDVLFEGNNGHYSITTAGNTYGNHASFLRESSPAHHGFGATSSAFGTVYHRCNQFGGPEGHGGYPQGTLYDLNEGDLSLAREGGSPPPRTSRNSPSSGIGTKRSSCPRTGGFAAPTGASSRRPWRASGSIFGPPGSCGRSSSGCTAGGFPSRTWRRMSASWCIKDTGCSRNRCSKSSFALGWAACPAGSVRAQARSRQSRATARSTSARRSKAPS